MCGIAGIFSGKRSLDGSNEEIKKMVSMLDHRGPDSTGFYTDENISLGHARLSIIDLSTGQQPIHNEDNSLWTIFNGEIFNYLELREDLVKKGHVFYTHSDTEVIVHLYEEYGKDFVQYLNGQYAIALYDKNKEELLLIRDRVGIVPLFYTQKNNRIYFASEIKSILKVLGVPPTLNYNALDQIMTFWSPVSPETIFKDIYEVSPGHQLAINAKGINKHQYWDWEYPIDETYLKGSEDELAGELKELLIDATRIRLRSDVPVGAYLSGGLDSSSIVTLINNYTNNDLRTFSIGFDEGDFDETDHQNILIKHLNTNHSYVKCSNSDIADEFVDTIWHTETPILRTAPVPMKILSGLVKENDYKVVLTGEGADEVLGGYDIFKETKIRNYWSKNVGSARRPVLLKKLYPYLDMSQGATYLKTFFGQGLDKPNDFSFSHITRWASTAKCKNFLSQDAREQINVNALDLMDSTLPDEFSSWNYFNRAQYIESKSLMSGYLLNSQGDRMLMSNSVEGRFPFLDHRLIEFANKLHPKFKMKALNEKFLLKKAMSNDLPPQIVKRYKQPYRAPNIPAFFSEGPKDFVMELLSTEKINSYGYFDSKKVDMLSKKIQKGRAIGNNDNMALIAILSTQVWHNLFVENYHKNFA